MSNRFSNASSSEIWTHLNALDDQGLRVYDTYAALVAAIPAPSLGMCAFTRDYKSEYRCLTAGTWTLWSTTRWFTDFAMGANWSNANSFGYTVREGVGYFRGELYGTASSGSVALTMPVGARPGQRVVWNLPRSTVVAAAAGTLNTDGTLVIAGTIPTATPGLNLGGCSFVQA